MSKFYCAPVFVSLYATKCNNGSFKAATFFHHLILAELQYYFFIFFKRTQPQLNHKHYENSYYSPRRKSRTCRSWLA